MPIQQKLGQWWQERSERERRILAVWAAAGTALSLWFGAGAPLMQRIAVLERRVPELEMLLNRMRAQPPAGTGAAVAGQSAGDAAYVERVFVVQPDQTVKAVEVTTGIQDNTHIEITSGLTDSLQVVSGPYNVIAKRLKDGHKVKLSAAQSAP